MSGSKEETLQLAESQVANRRCRGRGRDRPWEHQGREGGIEYREMRHQPMCMNIVSNCHHHMSPHSHLVQDNEYGNTGQEAHQDDGFGCAMDIAIGLGPVGYLKGRHVQLGWSEWEMRL